MKKTLALLLTLILILFAQPLAHVEAREIDSIDMTVTLHQDGSATIRDNRVFSTYEGTEHYIALKNLNGNRALLDYRVYDSQGNELERIDSWDLSWSREYKAGKYGLVETYDGYEISFGYGEYGTHNFIIEYKISNMVFNLEDGNQALYWNFIDMGDPVSDAKIMITNDIGLTFQYPDTRIWGFGFDGETSLNENSLEATTSYLSSSEYMVLLTIFEGQPFSTNHIEGWTEERLIDLAFEGVDVEGIEDYDPYGSNAFVKNDFDSDFLSGFLSLIVFLPLLTMILSLYIKNVNKNNNGKSKIKKKPLKNEIPYYRQVPSEDFINIHELFNSDTENIISAYILKWVFEGSLLEEKHEVGFIFKKEKLRLKISQKSNFDNKVEKKLWEMILLASGDDLILTEKEFSKYIRRNLREYESWIDTIDDYSREYLLKHGYIEITEKKFLWISSDEAVTTDQGEEKREQIYGFKKYLNDYSLISEREVSEVRLWNQYLIWAAYYGIADKVYKQFEIVDPTFSQRSDFDVYDTIILTRAFSYNVNRTYTNATTLRSRSFSGGGGMSFGGGGGGSFGGGGGGSR